MTRRIHDPMKAKIVEAEANKASAVPAITTPQSGVDLKDLLDKTRVILYREIQGLMQESSGQLLSKESSQALVNYIKLLKELIKDENALFDDMSDEELENLLKHNEAK